MTFLWAKIWFLEKKIKNHFLTADWDRKMRLVSFSPMFLFFYAKSRTPYLNRVHDFEDHNTSNKCLFIYKIYWSVISLVKYGLKQINMWVQVQQNLFSFLGVWLVVAQRFTLFIQNGCLYHKSYNSAGLSSHIELFEWKVATYCPTFSRRPQLHRCRRWKAHTYCQTSA